MLFNAKISALASITCILIFGSTLPLVSRFDPCAGTEVNLQASSPGSPPEMASVQVSRF